MVRRRRESSFDLAAVERLAGPAAFQRGMAYCADGRVVDLREQNGALSATVRGTFPYDVAIAGSGKRIDYDCSCPVGADGEFCKHCVAVVLAWSKVPATASTSTADAVRAQLAGRRHGAGSRRAGHATDDLRAVVAAMSKDALVAVLVDAAAESEPLRRTLVARTAVRTRGGLDPVALRRTIRDVIVPRGFIEYREMASYAQTVERLIGQLAAIPIGEFGNEIVDLCEYALRLTERAMESVNDSNGYMSGILQRLQDLHLTACRSARPDGVALAARLFTWEATGEWDTFFGAYAAYAPVLGATGRSEYRRLAEAAWAAMPALGPGSRTGFGGKRFRLSRIMEALANESGDLGALVDVMSKDLSSAWSYLRVATACAEAGDRDRALEWAERGLQAFPARTDERLREFLANEYHRRKRHPEAMELVWASFEESPSLESYRALKRHAARAGDWPAWRERALVTARALGGDARPKAAAAWVGRPVRDRSVLVHILLSERRVDAAWREATEGGCSPALWLELAAKREVSHPADAVAIYQPAIERSLAQKNNRGYQEAVGFAKQVRVLMTRLGRASDFERYLGEVRRTHKAKRNFIKLLDDAKLSG